MVPKLRGFILSKAVLLMLAVLSYTGRCGADTRQEAQDLYAKANELLYAGKYAEAIDHYNRALELQPEAENGYIQRAAAKWELKDSSGARADLALASQLNPRNPMVYAMHGVLKYNEKDYYGAVADYTRAIELAPDDVAILVRRGVAHTDLENWEEAIDDLSRVLRKDPTAIDAFYFRSKAYTGIKEPGLARADLNRVIKEKPEYGEAYQDRAWICFFEKEWAAAIDDARMARKLRPNAVRSIALQGFAEFGAGDFAVAASTLAEAFGRDGVENFYAGLLYHYAQQRLGKADELLANALAQGQVAEWQEALMKFVLGQMSEEQLDDLAEGSKEAECEAHFYIGLARLAAGDRSSARLRFRSAMATGIDTFIEYTLADVELQRF